MHLQRMTIHNTEASGLEGELAPTGSLQPGSVSATATLSCSMTGATEQKEGPPAASGYRVSASQESERGPGHSVGIEEGLARTTAGSHVCHPNSERGGLDSKPAPFLWAPRICFLKHGCVRHGDLHGLQTDSFHPALLLSSEQSHCCQPPGSVPHPLRVHPCQVPISLSLISSNCTSEWGLQALLQEKSALGSGVTSEHPQDCLWAT